jgi:hypothetical protein
MSATITAGSRENAGAAMSRTADTPGRSRRTGGSCRKPIDFEHINSAPLAVLPTLLTRWLPLRTNRGQRIRTSDPPESIPSPESGPILLSLMLAAATRSRSFHI